MNINSREPIITDVGIISGRDAIHLDLVEQREGEIKFQGEINTGLVEIKNNIEKDWLKYKLSFKGIVYFKCCELDFYTSEKLLISSFDKINNSEKITKLKSLDHSSKIDINHKHYVFATYDYVYEIIASQYFLEINID
jgi:hypothetical protein